MKQTLKILKFALYITGGIGIGLVISVLGLLLFTDMGAGDIMQHLSAVEAGKLVIAICTAIAALVASVIILVTLHEAGHLVCGLLTGYKFVSFRIFSHTIVRIDGRLRLKRFAVAGTGGQCLLTPPEAPLEDIPTGWYNAGGVLANLAVMAIALPVLIYGDLDPLLHAALLLMVLTDGAMILMNGIPMQVSGIANDAANVVYLKKDAAAKRCVELMLRSNAKLQEGVRPKDMPDEWFVAEGVTDYRNPLKLAVPLMAASRLVDEMRWEDAHEAFGRLYDHRNEIMALYVKEIACELAFTAMATGRISEAERLLDKELLTYMETYRKVSSSKERIMCARELYLNNNREAAQEIYRRTASRSGEYLLQGEVMSDVAVMRRMLGER